MKFDSGSSVTGPVGVDVAQRRARAPGSAEPVDQLVDPGAGRVVGRRGVGAGAEVGVGDDQDRLADVVEEDHPVVEGERQVGQAAVVGGASGRCSV